MKIKKYFASPILSSQIPKAMAKNLNKDLLHDIEVLKKIDDEGILWSKSNYTGGYTSYGSITDLNLRHPAFMDLQKHIDKAVRAFVKELEVDLQGRSLKMTSCWVNVMPKGVHHSLHLHPLCFLSGTYYVKTPKGSGAIKFEDPRMGLLMAAPPLKSKLKKADPRFIKIQPNEGQFMLWESWLRHEVMPNTSQQERISVSFNYEWI